MPTTRGGFAAPAMAVPTRAEILDTSDEGVFSFRSRAHGPEGGLPFAAEELTSWPSGDLFGWSQDVGMGWPAAELRRPEVLLLSTHGGLRDEQGRPIALGFHTGHWEIAQLAREAAEELRGLGALPFAAYCSDPCDGRTQGTAGMMDSLPYRNDAARVFGRLIRSLPNRRGVLGLATCDKGLPAMLMALASCRELPVVLIPGGVMLAPEAGAEDTAKVQTIGTRAAHGLLTLAEAAELGCRACASPGGGCQFLGTAATAQVVAEAMGLSLPHAALAPSGLPIWRDMARRSARALWALMAKANTGTAGRAGVPLTPAGVRNAMVAHAAFGGSTNLLIHVPAIAHAAGLAAPTVADWIEVNRRTPRLVDALPNGPVGHATAHVYMAGGVPEVMLHLRELGLIEGEAPTVAGGTWNEMLDWWRGSARRRRLREELARQGVDPEDVILSPERARARGLARTLCFPRGNLAPEGAVIKSTAIDPSVLDAAGVYHHVGPARVFTREEDAIAAIKGAPAMDGRGEAIRPIRPGDVLVLIGRGPAGAGMPEIYQITSALRHLPWGKEVAVLTDARFSGVSTGACVGHVSPEALAGGPIGKLRDGDRVLIHIDPAEQSGRLEFLGGAGGEAAGEEGERELGGRELAARLPHPDLRPDPELPADTRLWAALQGASGGVWRGCVFDVEAIVRGLNGGHPSQGGAGG